VFILRAIIRSGVQRYTHLCR